MSNKDKALAFIQRLLYWDWENECWDDDRARDWNGFDELSDIDAILRDQNLVPKEGDPPPPEFPDHG